MLTYDTDPQQDVARAFGVLKTDEKLFASVQVEVGTRIRALNDALSGPIPACTPERLEFAIRLLDARAEPYLDLVSNLRSQEAYAVLLSLFVQISWGDYVCINGAMPMPGNRDMGRMEARQQYWLLESYKRVSAQHQALRERLAETTRRGYRTEVRAWMNRKGLGSVLQASKRLGVSETTLKSIMSDKGEVRYSSDTLTRVLTEIAAGKQGD